MLNKSKFAEIAECVEIDIGRREIMETSLGKCYKSLIKREQIRIVLLSASVLASTIHFFDTVDKDTFGLSI